MSTNPSLPRILLVEDDALDARVVERALAKSADSTFRVRSADSAAAAEQALRNEDFDLVLLDLNLPDSKGLETYHRVEDVAEDTSIVVLTGDEDPRSCLAAMRAGAEDYLVKGEFEGAAIARAVRRTVERRANRERRRLEERRMEEAQRARRFATMITDIASELDEPVGLLLQTSSHVEHRLRGFVRACERLERRVSDPAISAEQRSWIESILREVQLEFSDEVQRELVDAREATASSARRTREILGSMRHYLDWRASA